jgi:hypothetical protein
VSLGDASAEPKAEQARQKAVAKHASAARRYFAQQDLDGAIREWDIVLALDPGNASAKLERERAVQLRDKLRRLPASAPR